MWCSTCGRSCDSPECPRCAHWWSDNKPDCCPDPLPEELDMPLDDIIANHGFDPRSTPLDTLAAEHAQMHHDVAWAMEHGDEPADC